MTTKKILACLPEVLQVDFSLYQLWNSVCVNSAFSHLPSEYLIQYMDSHTYFKCFMESLSEKETFVF